jgi:hypothetical protein
MVICGISGAVSFCCCNRTEQYLGLPDFKNAKAADIMQMKNMQIFEPRIIVSEYLLLY